MVEVDLVEIGTRIQNRRKQRGYTQEQLADLMNVSKQMISNLERGNKAIRIDNLINLSRVLDISADYILTGKEISGDFQSLAAQLSRLSQRDRRMIELIIAYCAAQEE